MRIVFNAIIAKPEGMGGFNVAKNFYQKTLEDKENEWFYFVSEAFDKEINRFVNGLDNKHYFIFHTQPDFKHYFSDKRRIRSLENAIKPNVIYSILAPSYHRFKTVEVMRCANAWTVVGGVNKYAWKVTPLSFKIRYFIKASITRLMMRNTKYFITQSNIAKQCILRTVHTSPDNVFVVSNVLSEKFLKDDAKKAPHSGFNMVYVSSPSVHKDYLLLPQVAYILVHKYGLKNFKIYVTVPEYCDSRFIHYQEKYHVKDFFINHGFLGTDELIQCYSHSDLALFPSLLETFSATLLEYMYFQLPIVASDFDFNKEVAQDAAVYFLPHDAEDMAKKIFMVYSNDTLKRSLLENAKIRLNRYNNNADKYLETVSFLRRVAVQD